MILAYGTGGFSVSRTISRWQREGSWVNPRSLPESDVTGCHVNVAGLGGEILGWRMGLLWLPGHLDVPAVHDGEPGADVPDRDHQVHHAVSGLQSCGAAGDFKDLPSRNWIFCPGSCNHELISSGRWPRDTIWREDDQHAHHSNGPRAMATLRNMTLGLFAIHGITKLTVQSIGRNPLHAVRLIT